MEFENLLTLIKNVSESNLTGLVYEQDGVKIKLTKECQSVSGGVENQPAIEVPDVFRERAQEETEQAVQSGKVVKSPLVGTFYAAPSEEADPYVKVGDAVKKDQTLAIVEAMKLMNEIESEFDGTIEEIYVENGQMVEYGQPLFRIS